jgi:hypothetical protein
MRESNMDDVEMKEKGPTVGVSYNVTIEQFRKGVLIDYEEIHNLTVNAGLEYIKSHLHNSNSPAVMDYVAIGESATAPAAGQTALLDESMREQGTYASGATGVCTVVNSFTIDGTYSIVESGLLNAAASGTMIARVTFAAKAVVASDVLVVTWTCTYTST